MSQLDHYHRRQRTLCFHRKVAVGQRTQTGKATVWPWMRRQLTLRAVRQLPGIIPSSPVLSVTFQGSGSIAGPELSETGRTVPDMHEPLSRCDVTVTAGCDGGHRPHPAVLAAAAN
jgi:hypothetical protein